MICISNEKAENLICEEELELCSLNILFYNEETTNFYYKDTNNECLIRFSENCGTILMAIAFFKINENWEKISFFINSSLEEFMKKDIDAEYLSIQVYEDDILISLFCKLGFSINLILREHIKIKDRYYNVYSLSKALSRRILC